MTTATRQDAVGVARQGIYDRDGSLVGYELLFRLPPASEAPVLSTEAEHEHATAEVIRAVVERQARDDFAHGLLLFVNVPRAFVVGDLPLSLAPDKVVVEVLEHVVPDDELLRGVQDLRRRGYAVAVDDWNGDADRRELIAAANFVKIDIQQVPRQGLQRMVSEIREAWPEIRIVLERVESPPDHVLAMDSGADLFQGFHLQAPEYLEVD